MQLFKDRLRQYIAHKHLGREMIGVISVKEVKKFFPDKEVDGYVKFNKIFIKTQDQQVKIDVFKKKQDILARVNEALAQVGYTTKMIEIFLK